MDKTMIYVAHNGIWNASNKYVDHEVKIMFVEHDIKYVDLPEKIHKELNVDRRLSFVKILINAKMDTTREMKIENDDNIGVYVHLIKNTEEFNTCPPVVEIEEKWANSYGAMVSGGDIEMYVKIIKMLQFFKKNQRETSLKPPLPKDRLIKFLKKIYLSFLM